MSEETRTPPLDIFELAQLQIKQKRDQKWMNPLADGGEEEGNLSTQGFEKSFFKSVNGKMIFIKRVYKKCNKKIIF